MVSPRLPPKLFGLVRLRWLDARLVFVSSKLRVFPDTHTVARMLWIDERPAAAVNVVTAPQFADFSPLTAHCENYLPNAGNRYGAAMLTFSARNRSSTARLIACWMFMCVR